MSEEEEKEKAQIFLSSLNLTTSIHLGITLEDQCTYVCRWEIYDQL